ncbi:MAG TPA: type VI secretion system baseplate subunit TssG [Phycisphaerae bacterium]|jgi:type VI secretion system protein ImpH
MSGVQGSGFKVQDAASAAVGGGSAPAVPPLLQRMLTRGWEFDFFQAVWLLERYLSAPAGSAGASPSSAGASLSQANASDNERPAVPLGERGPVTAERLRLRPYISVGFPSTDVRRISRCPLPDHDEFFYRLDVTFMGLYGVSTPLPLHYAISILRSVESVPGVDPAPAGSAGASPSQAIAAVPATDNGESSPMRDFLDIFHHRVLSLFYRAWAKYRYDVSFGVPGRDIITDYLLWLIGLSRVAKAQEVGVSPIRLIRYAGLLTQHPRSAATLEGMLLDYWGEQIPVRVDQFQGRWVALSPGDLNHMGVANARLGVDLTVGEEVYDLSGAFGVSMGPVDWHTYLSFLPDGEGYAQTKALIELYCTDPLAFTIEMKINAQQVPITRLTCDEQAGRLGFTSWIRTDEMGETSVNFDATRHMAAAAG